MDTLLSPNQQHQGTEDILSYVCCRISDASFRWPETRLGPLEPKDRRFPLPGMVGSSTATSATSPSQGRRIERRPRYDADVLVAELPYERQSTAFEQFVAVNTEVHLTLDTLNDF